MKIMAGRILSVVALTACFAGNCGATAEEADDCVRAPQPPAASVERNAPSRAIIADLLLNLKPSTCSSFGGGFGGFGGFGPSIPSECLAVEGPKHVPLPNTVERPQPPVPDRRACVPTS